MAGSWLRPSPLLCLAVLGCLSQARAGPKAPKNPGPARRQGPARRPHLVFIMVDDQGYNDVGYHGSHIRTPVLDRLARRGVRLENYYVQPICSPSRSQLMTGRYQIHTGLQHSIIRPRQPLCLPADAPTLPERLRQAGYATHMVGKWHLGFSRRGCLPTGRGFQSFLGSLTGSADHFSFTNCDGSDACGFDLHDGERPAWELRGNYSTLLYAHRAKQILRAHDRKRPLFLYLALQAVHAPLQAPARFLRQYGSLGDRERRRYAAMLSCVDEAVGAVVRELRDRGLYRDSVLVYSSDNGGQPLSGGCNWPLRGGKGTEGVPSPRTEILFNIDPVSPRPGRPSPRTLRAGFGIWDTAVRAAIRAGDWKLLTGRVGTGTGVPPDPAGGPRGLGRPGEAHGPAAQVGLALQRDGGPPTRRELSGRRPAVVRALLAGWPATTRPPWPPGTPRRPPGRPRLHGACGAWQGRALEGGAAGPRGGAEGEEEEGRDEEL
ncbi:hypothetical protein ANANG_G00305110 [Anguilla anguilla]|uniref:Sulfatase N-terminal domain-containing protein n=1 Tax=Anguilla anguilla TaxID=7936 RepID=A0A9D3RIU7_ANGAN|nr:hypothetical protein ANANG_G00305110 [Anguilla anguilla]